MSAADWYARKLGRPPAPQQPQPQPQSYPQQQQPVHQQNYPPQYQQQPQPAQQWEGPINKDNIFQAMATWRGGKGSKLTDRCPECDSTNYFAQRGKRVMNQTGQLVHPAPHCYDCGFNGLFEQGHAPEGAE